MDERGRIIGETTKNFGGKQYVWQGYCTSYARLLSIKDDLRRSKRKHRTEQGRMLDGRNRYDIWAEPYKGGEK